MQKFKFYIVILIFTFYLLSFLGCASVSPLKPTVTPQVPGIYHRVERGQTLWRISKLYNVDLDEIVRVNRISEATNIEIGQQIFIPHRQRVEYKSYKSSGFEDFIWPLKGKVTMVTKGINIHPYRASDVVAASGGRVVFSADNFAGFGKTVIIDHGNGFLSVYAGNAQVFVKPGEVVQKGNPIAKVNNYLHFQIRKGHIPQNPYFYLAP